MEDTIRTKTAKQVCIDADMIERNTESDPDGNNMEENRKSITISGVQSKRNIMVNNG